MSHRTRSTARTGAPRARLRQAALGALAAAALTALAPAAALALAADISFPFEQEAAPYAPSDVTINAGESVTFSGSFAEHPLRWVTNDFATRSTGGSGTYAFPTPGLYRFVCDFHSDMTGSVRVAGNQLATPDFTVAPAAPVTGAPVTFDASALTDPDGTISSYEWDLDGNGSFETKGPAKKVSETYARAGTVKVGLRYVDNGHETSSAFVRDVVIAAGAAGGGGAGGGGAGGGGGGGDGAGGGGSAGGGGAAGPGGGPAGSASDRTAPKPTLTAASRRTIRVIGGVARIGLRIDERSTVSARLLRGALVVGRAATTTIKRGAGSLRVQLNRTGIRAVKRHRRTTLVIAITTRDAAGNVRTTRRSLTLTR